jgi:prepilin-type N-terminal cleavage/methylation domain-containing protein
MLFPLRFRRAAFTLVELLTVVAIVGVLVARAPPVRAVGPGIGSVRRLRQQRAATRLSCLQRLY